MGRGHVTLSARWTEQPERATGIKVNVERARDLVAAMTKLRDALDLPGQIDLGFVARQPEVLTAASADEIQLDADAVYAVVDGAVEGMIAMRQREGGTLGHELSGHLRQLEDAVQRVRERAPARLEAERDRLRESVAQLLDGRKLDEDRLSQEIALIADKLDITEELVRLKAHIDACEETLRSSEPW